MTNEKTRPDYGHWSKYDRWDFKEAALLLHDLDPSRYLKVRFNSKDIPPDPDLNEPYKTFLVLKKCRDFEYSNFAHPSKILNVAIEKNLTISEKLLGEFSEQQKREKQIREALIPKNQNVKSDKAFTTRERNALLKSIAIMAIVLARLSSNFQVKGRPNPYQIGQAVLDEAQRLGVEPDGLKSLDRKITQALEIFFEESL